MVWRRDPARDGYLPAGHLAAFSPVRAERMVPQHGLVEIRARRRRQRLHRRHAAGARRSPGGAAGLLRLQRRATAAERRGARPPRRRHGSVSRSATAAPATGGGQAARRLRPCRRHACSWRRQASEQWSRTCRDGAYRPDFAIGELWSRACNDFAAGMRAQRFGYFASPAGLSPLLIPPDLSAAPAPVDIPDEVFEHE